MIKENELRIGNYYNAFGILKQVTKETFSTVHFNSIQPIPLTEQWLKDFGFKLYPWGYVKNGILIKYSKSTELQHLWIEMGNGKRIELPFVHTLQNTYFCIEQKDL